MAKQFTSGAIKITKKDQVNILTDQVKVLNQDYPNNLRFKALETRHTFAFQFYLLKSSLSLNQVEELKDKLFKFLQDENISIREYETSDS